MVVQTELSFEHRAFQPILKKVFPHGLQKYSVQSGSKPGDNFTGDIFAVTASFEKSKKTPPSLMQGLMRNKSSINLSDMRRKRGKRQKSSLNLIVKCFPNNPSVEGFIRKIDIFRKELEVYRQVFPEFIRFQTEELGIDKENVLEPSVPRFYGGAYLNTIVSSDDDSDDSSSSMEVDNKSIQPNDFIMLEDLRQEGYRMANKFQGLDYAHCCLVIKELAKLHVLSMAYRRSCLPGSSLSDHFDCLKETILTPETEEISTAISTSTMRTTIDIVERVSGPDSIHSQKVRQFGDRLSWPTAHFLTGNAQHMSLQEQLTQKPDFHQLHEQNKEGKRRDWVVFTHGDCWSNNVLFKYDSQNQVPISAKLIDFQIARENCLTADLSYFIYLCTTRVFRQKYLNQLLREYYEFFLYFCQYLGEEPFEDFTLTNLQAKFHKAKNWGVQNALFIFPIIFSQMNEEDSNELLKSNKNDTTAQIPKGSKLNQHFLSARVVDLVDEMVCEGVF